MLYLTCPTCGYFLGQKTTMYEKGKETICANPQTSKSDKEEAISKLLLSLKLKRECCKMRMMSYKDIVYDILPIIESK